jgi:C4-dicarboxylate-specific signal transduction histidine kinase
MAGHDDLYDRLRRLAVEDPQEARKRFLAAFEANSAELSDFLIRLSRPSDGRLRQIVANALRTHPHKGRIVRVLLSWRETETDEFTRRAIEGALADVENGGRESTFQEQTIEPRQLADVYRYVADRLRHRLLNTMLSAQAQADQLKTLVRVDPRGDVQTAIAKLNDAMISMGRELAATNVDPDHFSERSVVLPDWLRQMNGRYADRYAPIKLQLIEAGTQPIRVLASDYLLEMIFWNVWENAHEAVQENCEITIEFAISAREVEMLVSDNGDGFPAESKDVVFQQVHSTKDASRGRGMLEIQDAVGRLRGTVALYEARPSEYRIRLRLPRDVQ